jgi:hypothetical protein
MIGSLVDAAATGCEEAWYDAKVGEKLPTRTPPAMMSTSMTMLTGQYFGRVNRWRGFPSIMLPIFNKLR